MKTNLSVVVILSILASSCEKDGSVAASTAAIFGKWEVKKEYGRNILPPDSIFQTGNGNILSLNNDSTYKKYERGILMAQGTFHTIKNGFKSDTSSYNTIYFDDQSNSKSVIILNHDELTLRPLFPDVGSTDYAKISGNN